MARFRHPLVRELAITDVDYGDRRRMVYGVGFVPRLTLWRLAFHPFVGWALMGGGSGYVLSAA